MHLELAIWDHPKQGSPACYPFKALFNTLKSVKGLKQPLNNMLKAAGAEEIGLGACNLRPP
eukprot:1484396-Heterocapsa_arctica.AAC.1